MYMKQLQQLLHHFTLIKASKIFQGDDLVSKLNSRLSLCYWVPVGICLSCMSCTILFLLEELRPLKISRYSAVLSQCLDKF